MVTLRSLRTPLPLFVLLVASGAFAAEDTAKPFKFVKCDLSLLEQVEMVDKKFDRDGLVFHDAQLDGYVERVGKSMLPSGSPLEKVTWEFHVLRDPSPNAFAMPNGSIYVHTGLLSLLENEDQLASVLAHEITHVLDRHTYLSYRDYRKKSAIANIAAYAASMAPGGTAWGIAVQVAGTLIPVIMQISVEGYGRDLERRADLYSYEKLIEGGYEPREMANTFRLLDRKDEVQLRKTYYTDHPKLEDRINYMTALVQSKNPQEVPAATIETRRVSFQAATQRVDLEDIRLAIMSNRPRTALVRAKKLLDFDPAAAENYVALGDAYRSLGPHAPRPTSKELSEDGLKEGRKLQKKFTAEEEERELLSRPEGSETWKENAAQAESSYKQALTIDPSCAKAYRGLGMLYQKTTRPEDAVAAYRQYLELRPDALDAQQIRSRIESLERPQIKQ